MKLDTSDLDQAEPVAVAKSAAAPALLFEMIRSFVTLARTLNLSHAVKELNSTRQTLRRHIAALEAEMGLELFKVEDRRYSLTEAAEQALPEAIDLIAKSNLWLSGTTRHHESLQYVSFGLPNGWTFHQQQHPLSTIWSGQSVLMRETLRAWAMSGGDIEAPELAHVRPYLIVYRATDSGWISVEFGEECFYVKWFGWAKARSSIGRPLSKMPGGDDFARLLEEPFSEVTNTQSARVDHVATQVPRGEENDLVHIRYARLMLGGCFPDGSQALFSLVEPLSEVTIDGLEMDKLPPIPKGVVLDFVESEAKYEKINPN